MATHRRWYHSSLCVTVLFVVLEVVGLGIIDHVLNVGTWFYAALILATIHIDGCMQNIRRYYDARNTS